MKNKMFVIPGGFVPYNDTVTLLTYKRLRNLDLDIDVFALKGKEDPSITKELESDANYKKFNIKYTSDYDWAVSRNYPLRLPISILLMAKYAFDSTKEFKKKEYKYLYTSIVPGISHIAGKAIKKRNPNVIWYASFSDPFKGSPYKDVNLENHSIFYKIAFKVGAFFFYNNKYEEAAVKYADKLIFICEEQRDFTLSQYPNSEELKKKSIIMPLTFIKDWNIYNNLLIDNEVNNTPKKAVHLGRLYGLRKIDTFLDALKELKEEYPNLSEKIVFHQYSEIQEHDIKKIESYGLQDLFIVHNKVTYNESVEIMKNADILVLFDTLMPEAKVQPYLPSKIVEYLMLKKPILGICGNNSPSYRILIEYGYDTVGYEKEIIKENILKIINKNQIHNYSLDRLDNDNNTLLI